MKAINLFLRNGLDSSFVGECRWLVQEYFLIHIERFTICFFFVLSRRYFLNVLLVWFEFFS